MTATVIDGEAIAARVRDPHRHHPGDTDQGALLGSTLLAARGVGERP